MTVFEPLISVVIPVYNYAHVLRRALDSVLKQLDDEIEVVVIDDGSTDESWAIITSYAEQYSRLKAIRQVNAGAAAARNHAIREAGGRYALLLDADDELMPGALACLKEQILARPDAGMFLGEQISVFPDGRERHRTASSVPALSPEKIIHRYLLQKRISISHGCSMFRRELLLQRPYAENLSKGEDIPVFAYCLISTPVVVVPQILARIHKHADSRRHKRIEEHTHVQNMVSEVFGSLPVACQTLRRPYEAQRYLSIFRSAYGVDSGKYIRRFYIRAVRLSPFQSFRWKYIKKFLLTFF